MIVDYSSLKKALDLKRVGLGGHDWGSHAVQVLAGSSYQGKSISIQTDTETKHAFLFLSPLGPAKHTGFAWNSFAKIKHPSLHVTGSQDHYDENHDFKWRMLPYTESKSANCQLAVFSECDSTFGGLTTNQIQNEL